MLTCAFAMHALFTRAEFASQALIHRHAADLLKAADIRREFWEERLFPAVSAFVASALPRSRTVAP